MDLLRSLSDAFRSIWVRFLPWRRGILSKSASTTELAAWLLPRTHTHTHIYIYIYIYMPTRNVNHERIFSALQGSGKNQ